MRDDAIRGPAPVRPGRFRLCSAVDPMIGSHPELLRKLKAWNGQRHIVDIMKRGGTGGDIERWMGLGQRHCFLGQVSFGADCETQSSCKLGVAVLNGKRLPSLLRHRLKSQAGRLADEAKPSARTQVPGWK